MCAFAIENYLPPKNMPINIRLITFKVMCWAEEEKIRLPACECGSYIKIG